jgi:hypothetical protein
MKREELKNLGLTDEQIDQVMTMHGTGITREKGKATEWEDKYNDLLAQNQQNTEKYANYDHDMEELASLRTYKEGVEFDKRFTAAVGDKKFVNDVTRNHVFGQFTEAAKDPSNEGKADADILAPLLEGHEADYLASKVSIKMTPSGSIPKESFESFLEERYKNRN